MKTKTIINLLSVILILNCPSRAADVLFIDASSSPSIAQKQLEFACHFYGLALEHIAAEQNKNIHQLLQAGEIQAIVIAAEALPRLEAQKIFSALRHQRKQNIPILIMGLTAMSDEKVLKKWSDRAVTGCLKSTEAPPREFYRVASSKALTRDITGHDLGGFL